VIRGSALLPRSCIRRTTPTKKLHKDEIFFSINLKKSKIMLADRLSEQKVGTQFA
jgi:hypothetical protein